nr:hypothetical protein Iba_chr02fCG11530 [Ipomoea batatas]
MRYCASLRSAILRLTCSPRYSRTISPSGMFLRAKRPHLCMPDRPKQTRSFSVLCKWRSRSLKVENVLGSSTFCQGFKLCTAAKE